MLDPVSRAIANAPIDDEPLTTEEEKALGAAREWSKHNQGILDHKAVVAASETEMDDEERKTDLLETLDAEADDEEGE